MWIAGERVNLNIRFLWDEIQTLRFGYNYSEILITSSAEVDRIIEINNANI